VLYLALILEDFYPYPSSCESSQRSAYTSRRIS